MSNYLFIYVIVLLLFFYAVLFGFGYSVFALDKAKLCFSRGIPMIHGIHLTIIWYIWHTLYQRIVSKSENFHFQNCWSPPCTKYSPKRKLICTSYTRFLYYNHVSCRKNVLNTYCKNNNEPKQINKQWCTVRTHCYSNTPVE